MRGRRGGPSGAPDGDEVELVEDDMVVVDTHARDDADTADAGDVPDTPSAAAAPDAPARRRRVLRRGAAVAVAVGLVVAANVVEIGRDNARLARLAAVPGVMAPLDTPLTQTWRLPGAGLNGGVDGLVLVHDTAGVQAVDPASGEVRWRRTTPTGALAEYCKPVEEGPLVVGDDPFWRYRMPPAPAVAEPALLLCQVQSGFSRRPETSAPGPRLRVVDGGTGEDRVGFDQEGSLLVGESVGDGDVLSLVSTPDGHLAGMRWDARSGETVWSYRSPDAIFGPDAMDLQLLQLRGEVLLISARAGVALRLDTGAPVDLDAALGLTDPAWHERTDLGGGDVAVWSVQDEPRGQGYVLDAAGTQRYRLPGPVWWPSVHDGSVPDVLVTGTWDSSRLRGLDRATGQVRWSVDEGEGRALLQVEGVMVVHTGTAVTGLDVATGEVRWSVDAAGDAASQNAMTDGEVVLVVRDDDQDGLVLAAHALSDGAERWRSPLPDRVRSVLRTGTGDVVARTPDEVLGLGRAAAG